MNIRIRFFAGLRERLGRDSADLEVPDSARVAELKTALGETFPAIAPLLASSRVAIDQAFVGPDHPLTPGAEIALIPPVSGG